MEADIKKACDEIEHIRNTNTVKCNVCGFEGKLPLDCDYLPLCPVCVSDSSDCVGIVDKDGKCLICGVAGDPESICRFCNPSLERV